MDAQKLQLKIFVTPDSARSVDPEAFVDVFHRWIKQHLLPELLIDVAGYTHVPEGPGVVLIGHGTDYFMDQREGRLGLLHNRKRGAPPPAERLVDLARRTLYAASLLEGDRSLANLRFSTNELLLRVNDRLAGPNSDAAFAAMRTEIDALARRLFAGPFELGRAGGPKDLLSVRLLSRDSVPLATLLERAGGQPAPDASLTT